ncbi:MAG: S8 family peptidase [Anaerostipes sp.]|nr:S8 family peptidase [Anaerostipes sp.]MDD3745358.1 S8 family peptidase [Anaerostipes sp.]
MHSISNQTKAYIAHSHGFFGKNISIAYLDTGVFMHPDFITPKCRILDFVDFVSNRSSPYDDNGHGTHICGISASNSLGIAPQSNIIMVKVLDYSGNGSKDTFIKGLEWIDKNRKKYEIRIVNISIGMPSNFTDEDLDPLIQKVEQLWDHGMIVCIASGNNGPGKYSISSPGISRKVITVGSSNDAVAAINSVSYTPNYSSRGPTHSCVMKPDVVAPGTNIPSCSHKKGFSIKSGTSMATPIVSGAMALLLERYPDYTNKAAKLKLRSSCDKLPTSRFHQGWGQINIQKLLDLEKY